jgi:hypothetical protein
MTMYVHLDRLILEGRCCGYRARRGRHIRDTLRTQHELFLLSVPEFVVEDLSERVVRSSQLGTEPRVSVVAGRATHLLLDCGEQLEVVEVALGQWVSRIESGETKFINLNCTLQGHVPPDPASAP